MPPGHLAHFGSDAGEAWALRTAKVNARGPGAEPFPPAMMRALLIDRAAPGALGRRRIARRTRDSVPARRITAAPTPITTRSAPCAGKTKPF